MSILRLQGIFRCSKNNCKTSDMYSSFFRRVSFTPILRTLSREWAWASLKTTCATLRDVSTSWPSRWPSSWSANRSSTTLSNWHSRKNNDWYHFHEKSTFPLFTVTGKCDCGGENMFTSPPATIRRMTAASTTWLDCRGGRGTINWSALKGFNCSMSI